MHAWRVARAHTGKMKIVKFEGQYHGWADEQKVTIGADTLEELGPKSSINKLMNTAGQRIDTTNDIIVAPWNDAESLEAILDAHDDIAAVLMEPYMCDEGPILPKEGYLQAVRDMCAKRNVLLIFDEVITGFRLSLGGAQQYFGVTPDLAIFGKAIAGGFSLSMICGKKELMEKVHPSGTFNATPIAVAASLATIAELEKPGTYEKMDALGKKLTDGLMELGKKHGIKVYANHHNAICQLQLGIDRAPEDFRDCLQNVDRKAYDKLFLLATQYGVRLTSARGRIYISTAHTESDIDKTLEIFDFIFPMLKKQCIIKFLSSINHSIIECNTVVYRLFFMYDTGDFMNDMMFANKDFVFSILENSYDCIYITNKDSITVYVNKAYENLTGHKRSEYIGKHMDDLIKSGIMKVHITGDVIS